MKTITNPQATAEYQAAMDKLRDEMAAAAGKSDVDILGELLTAFLMMRPDAAGAILAKDKTLAGAYDAMGDYAEKNRGGKRRVGLDPRVALKIVMDYYGIKGSAPGFQLVPEDAPEAAPAVAPAPAPAAADALDLDALLAGPDLPGGAGL